MIGESVEASSTPAVSSSALSASSGGQFVSSRSCESLPLDTPIFSLRSVSDIAPGLFRYPSKVMHGGLAYLNLFVQAQSLVGLNDFSGGGNYNGRMADPRPDWFLKEWLAATGKKQADIVRDLDWNKAKVSLMVNLKQAYTREEVNELAEYLNIRPHELLMHPEDAFVLRRLKADMIRLAHETEDAERREPPRKKVSLN